MHLTDVANGVATGSNAKIFPKMTTMSVTVKTVKTQKGEQLCGDSR